MFLKIDRRSRGWGEERRTVARHGRVFNRESRIVTRERRDLVGIDRSKRSSSTMQTGAVPQLARHSTNSILYSPSALTATGCPSRRVMGRSIFAKTASCSISGSRLPWHRKGSGKRECVSAGRLPAEHRIERDQLENIDRLKAEPRRDPVDSFVANKTEVFLPQMQQRQRGAAFCEAG